MPAGSVAVKERHQPLVLVDTAGLSEEEWLAYRRKGIGGSDVAALLGISPWRTARDLFYDKLNIAVVEDHEDNWVALEMGHLLEPLVSEYQDDLRNGIAWLAFWREGRSWQAEAFHLDLDDTLYPEDRARLAEIQAADPRAVVVHDAYRE